MQYFIEAPFPVHDREPVAINGYVYTDDYYYHYKVLKNGDVTMDTRLVS